jgi:DNA (cytosine-5)-methyltransferase 1
VSQPRLLDLFCGAGGAAMGYHRAGFDVVGVDINPQPDYPFVFRLAEAVNYLRLRRDRIRGTYAVIHASPPCQSFTAYRRKGYGVGDGYPDLVAELRELLAEIGIPYLIENVPGAPLIDPVQLCGSSFGLDVRRHRLFESNLPLIAPPCDHAWQTPRFPPATNRSNLRRTVEVGVWRIPLTVQRDAMGIDWMRLRDLSEAIPPAYTAHLGAQVYAHVTQQEAA